MIALLWFALFIPVVLLLTRPSEHERRLRAEQAPWDHLAKKDRIR